MIPPPAAVKKKTKITKISSLNVKIKTRSRSHNYLSGGFYTVLRIDPAGRRRSEYKKNTIDFIIRIFKNCSLKEASSNCFHRTNKQKKSTRNKLEISNKIIANTTRELRNIKKNPSRLNSTRFEYASSARRQRDA